MGATSANSGPLAWAQEPESLPLAAGCDTYWAEGMLLLFVNLWGAIIQITAPTCASSDRAHGPSPPLEAGGRPGVTTGCLPSLARTSNRNLSLGDSDLPPGRLSAKASGILERPLGPLGSRPPDGPNAQVRGCCINPDLATISEWDSTNSQARDLSPQTKHGGLRFVQQPLNCVIRIIAPHTARSDLTSGLHRPLRLPFTTMAIELKAVRP